MKIEAFWSAEHSVSLGFIHPLQPRGHCPLAKVYREKGLLDDSIRHYQEAVRIKPDSLWYHFYLGQVCEQKGLLDQVCR